MLNPYSCFHNEEELLKLNGFPEYDFAYECEVCWIPWTSRAMTILIRLHQATRVYLSLQDDRRRVIDDVYIYYINMSSRDFVVIMKRS